MPAQNIASLPIEKMPGCDKVQRRIGGSEATVIEHTDQMSVARKEVSRNEIAMAHYVSTTGWQCAQLLPFPAKARYIQQVFAVPETGLDPLIMIRQIAASASS